MPRQPFINITYAVEYGKEHHEKLQFTAFIFPYFLKIFDIICSVGFVSVIVHENAAYFEIGKRLQSSKVVFLRTRFIPSLLQSSKYIHIIVLASVFLFGLVCKVQWL